MKALLIAASSLYVVTSHAADISKLGTGTNLADAASWTDSVVPGSSDIATWGGTSLATGLTLGTNVEWQGVRITGSSGSGTVSVTGAGTLSLGASGINLEGSAVGATFANALSLTADQSWRVNAGRTLTVSGALSGSGALSIGGAPAHTSSIFLTGTYQTIATNVTLDNVTGIAGIVMGGFVNVQRTGGAYGYLVSSSAGSQTYWLQTVDSGFVKAVKVELQQSGNDVQARATAAKFTSSTTTPGFDFETGGSAGTLATTSTSSGYGVFSLGLLTEASPTNQTGQVTLSGSNSSYSGNIQVNRGRLVFGSGTAFDGGNSPSAGTGTLTVGPLGVVANSVPNAIWGGHTNTRTVILNGGVIDLENHQEYFHTLEMTAGLVTRGTGESTTLFRVGSAAGAGRIVTNASPASAQIVGRVDLTFNNLRLEVADGAAVNDLVISAAISQNTGAGSGARSITKEGAGAVLLSGTNTFTGGVLVNAGTVRIGNQSALGTKNTAVGTVTVASGGTVDLNGVADATYGYTISGSGVGGAGALVNNGSGIFTYSAQTTNLRLAANATIGGTGEWGMLASVFGATSIDLAGFTLTKVGSGSFHLANTTFTAGSLSIQAGNVFINAGSTTVNASAVAVTLANVASASLGLFGKSLTLASLAGGGASGGSVTLGAGTLTVGDATTTNYAGSISGTGGVVKQGAGTLRLSASNTFSGGLTVAAGLVELNASAGFGGNNSASGTGALTVQSGATATTLVGFSISGLTGAGNTRVVNLAGTLNLVDSEYVRTYNLTGGTLNAPTLLNRFMRASEAGLFLNSLSAASSSTINGQVDLTFASVTIDTQDGAAANDLVIAGSISQNSNAGSGDKSLTKSGAGTLLLSGANSFSGGVLVNAGTIKFGHQNALGSYLSGRPVSQVVVASGASVDFNGVIDATYGYTISGAGVGGAGALVNNGGGIGNLTAQTSNILLAADATVGGSGNWALLTNGYAETSLNLAGFTLTKVGANTLTLVNATVTTGSIRVSAGTIALAERASTLTNVALTLDNVAGVTFQNSGNFAVTVGSLSGGGATGGNLALGSGSLNVGGLGTSTTYGGVISGSGSLTKSGAGTLTLTGANTYSGGTNLNSGSLEFASGSLGSTGTVTLAGGTLRWASGNTQDISSRLAFSSSAALDTNGNDVSLGSALSGSSSLTLTKSGAGTLTLSGASSGLSSGWTITAGTLKAGHVQAFGTGAIRVEGGVLDLNGLAVANVFRLAGGSVTGFTSLDASQLDFSTNSAPKLSGVIAGELNLTDKAVDATGGLTASGTLKGDGAVFSGGTVTLGSTAIHAPGSSPGTQTFESGLTYATGATLDWEIELDPGAWAAATPQRGLDYDAINVTGGNLVIGSGATLLVSLLDPLGASFTDSYWDEVRTLQAINFTSVGQITGVFTLDASDANAAASGRGGWSMTQDSGGVYLQWTPVPEPSTYGLILGGLALAGAALRRRRKIS
jgi:autotransporter-associated beta strand protein